MTTTVMPLGDPPPRNNHVGMVVPNSSGTFNGPGIHGEYTVVEPNTVIAGHSPLRDLNHVGSVVSGVLTVNGRPMNLKGAEMYFGEAGRELGVELDLVEPDITIDEARRIAAHRQRDIERLLGGDSPEG